MYTCTHVHMYTCTHVHMYVCSNKLYVAADKEAKMSCSQLLLIEFATYICYI